MANIDLYTTNLDSKWRRILQLWKTTKLKCSMCTTEFVELDNIGHWHCSQHFMQWNGDLSGTRFGPHMWDCCGDDRPPGFGARLGNLTGCIRSDHRFLSSPYTQRDDIPLPVNLYDLVKPHGESLPDPKVSQYLASDQPVAPSHLLKNIVIRRYDWKRQRAILESHNLVSVKTWEVPSNVNM
jgi:hypothetical protein